MFEVEVGAVQNFGKATGNLSQTNGDKVHDWDPVGCWFCLWVYLWDCLRAWWAGDV